MANPLYTPDEQKKIVDYIVEHEAFDLVKGDKIWKDMEKLKVVERSWQSLKQHFRKRIIYELHYPRYKLDPDVIDKFRLGFNKVVKRSNTSRKKKPTQDDKKYPDFSARFSSSDSDSGCEQASRGGNMNTKDNQVENATSTENSESVFEVKGETSDEEYVLID